MPRKYSWYSFLLEADPRIMDIINPKCSKMTTGCGISQKIHKIFKTTSSTIQYVVSLPHIVFKCYNILNEFQSHIKLNENEKRQ